MRNAYALTSYCQKLKLQALLMLVNDDDFVDEDKLNEAQHLMSTIDGVEVNFSVLVLVPTLAFVSTFVFYFYTCFALYDSPVDR
jgi:hypothetical protein